MTHLLLRNWGNSWLEQIQIILYNSSTDDVIVLLIKDNKFKNHQIEETNHKYEY